MKQGIPFWVWWKVNGNETTTWSKFANGGKAIVEQILASEEKNKCKRAGLSEWQSGICVGKFIICVRSFNIEKI